jgi:hypothetical protein
MNIINNLKDINHKSIRGLLIIVLTATAITLALFLGINYTQNKIANYLFESLTKPFLAQTLPIAQPLKR